MFLLRLRGLLRLLPLRLSIVQLDLVAQADLRVVEVLVLERGSVAGGRHQKLRLAELGVGGIRVFLRLRGEIAQVGLVLLDALE